MVCALGLLIGLAGYARLRSVPRDDRANAAPPVAAVKPVTEEYFGTKVTDPYRWLEDLKDPEVQKWFKGQDDYTR
jgi:prolyl oligopeptidase